MDYSWPGNVRELENVIEYAYVIGTGSLLRFSDLTPELRGDPPPGTERVDTLRATQEKRALLEALEASGWRKGVAAERLGISRSTLWRRLREFGLGRELPEGV